MENKTPDYIYVCHMILNEIEMIKNRMSSKKSFHDTRYAEMLFLKQIPDIIKALERIADSLEEQNKILDKTGHQL